MWRDREWGVWVFFAVMATLMAVVVVGVVRGCVLSYKNHALVNEAWNKREPVLPPAQYALLPVMREGEGKFTTFWGQEVVCGGELSLEGRGFWGVAFSPSSFWGMGGDVTVNCGGVALIIINKIDYDEQRGMMGKWPSDRRTFRKGVRMKVVKIVPLY